MPGIFAITGTGQGQGHRQWHGQGQGQASDIAITGPLAITTHAADIRLF